MQSKQIKRTYDLREAPQTGSMFIEVSKCRGWSMKGVKSYV